jgi:hypothetical protein
MEGLAGMVRSQKQKMTFQQLLKMIGNYSGYLDSLS